MAMDGHDLRTLWQSRNAAAESLGRAENAMRRACQAASVEELSALIDSFSPARSSGPEWSRTFEPLIEHLWLWRDDATMAALAEIYRARGMPWMAIANALSPTNGMTVRERVRHPAWARLPAFAIT